MAVVDPSGGGGRAGADTADVYALDKPYDINGEPTIERMQQADEMFGHLFKGQTRAASDITGLTATVGASGNVTGPASAVDGDVVLFDGTTGKKIKDGGTFSSLLQTGQGHLTFTANISNAQLGTLNSVPVEVVAAPGAGYIWRFRSFGIILTKTVASGGPSPTVTIRYNGIAVDLSSALATDLANARHYYNETTGSAGAPLNSSANPGLLNTSLLIRGSADGIGTSDATMRVFVEVVKVATAVW